MSNAKNKTATTAIAIVLMLTLGTIAISITNVSAKISLTMSTGFYPIIGENSPTLISWIPSPNIFISGSVYAGKTPVWNNATVTFTRPDGTKDVVNGPVTVKPQVVGGVAPRVELIYTPNMQGKWNVTFYWPGDDTYNGFNQTDAFIVGPHYGKRDTWAELSMNPYPVVGLGQQLVINAWVTPPPITQRDNFEGYLFTFTSPSGSSFTVGPMNSEGEATVWFNLPLTERGNWSIKFDFPGNFMYNPSTVTRTITVQSDWVALWLSGHSATRPAMDVPNKHREQELAQYRRTVGTDELQCLFGCLQSIH